MSMGYILGGARGSLLEERSFFSVILKYFCYEQNDYTQVENVNNPFILLAQYSFPNWYL